MSSGLGSELVEVGPDAVSGVANAGGGAYVAAAGKIAAGRGVRCGLVVLWITSDGSVISFSRCWHKDVCA